MESRTYSLLLLLLFGSLLPTCGHAQAQLAAGPMLGYAEQREVLVWVQTDRPAGVALEYTDSTGTAYVTPAVMTVPERAHTAHLIATGLIPGATYDYRILIDGTPVARDYPTRFTAQPTWRWRTDPPPFEVALGSCTYVNDPPYDRPGPGYGSEYFIFNSINEKEPDVMLWLGDNIYLREPDWYTRYGYYHRYSHTRALPEMQALLARTFNYAIWDDHDYGPNNSDRSWVRKELAKQTHDLFWGNLTSGLPGHGGITSTFRYMDMDFFLLDNRSFRTPNDQQRADNKTVLGTNQLEWLIESLIFSDAPYKMVCIGGQVLNTATRAETYIALAPRERAYLLRRIREENIKGVVFLTGDRHHTELSELTLDNGVKVYDLTVSSLTAGTGSTRTETNQHRVEGTLTIEHNFGILRFAGPRTRRTLNVTIYDAEGEELWSKDLSREE